RNGGDVDIGYVFCQGCHLVLWLQLCWQLEEFFANVLQVVFDELASFRLHCGVVPAALTEVRGYWFWVAPDLQTVAADADSLSADVCGVFGGEEGNEASHICCGAEAQFLAEKFWHWLTGLSASMAAEKYGTVSVMAVAATRMTALMVTAGR